MTVPTDSIPDTAELETLARDLLDMGLPVMAVSWEAVTHEQRPELFEPERPHLAGEIMTVTSHLPWPLEHAWAAVEPSDWKPHRLVADDEQAHLQIGSWAEMLLDCGNHPGMIVRKVRVEFGEPEPDEHDVATLVRPVLPPMLARSFVALNPNA